MILRKAFDRGLFLADKQHMRFFPLHRLGGILVVSMIVCALAVPLAAAGSAMAGDQKSARRDAYLASLAEMPAAQLLALARQARDEGRYQDAILLFQTAINSPWGQREFQDKLKESLAAANSAINAEDPAKLERLIGYAPPKGDAFLLSFLEYEKNPTTLEERVRLELQTYLVKPLQPKARVLVLKHALDLVSQELQRRFPNNPLKYYESHGRYFIEGYFNAEYPGIAAETNLELGLLYKSIQDYVQAEHYLNEALQHRSLLPVPAREYEIRYALAEIYVVRGKNFQYENALKEITSQDRQFISQEGTASRQRDQMRSMLLSDPNGLDKLLVLYRIPDDFSVDAHRQLGTLYLQRQDYEQSLMHLLFAVIKPFSKAMEEIRARDYEYTFTSLQDFFRESRQFPEIQAYLANSHFYESLYDLSLAIPGYQPNFMAASRRIWQVLALSPEAGTYQSISADKLKKLKR